MKFKITLADQSLEFRATSYEEFHNELCNAPEADGYAFFVDGKMVTKDVAFAAVVACREAALAKKEKTHKRVRISQGATTLSNTYREVWVRK